ncbi:hypothetical protein MMC31_005255, partial [Peltigera leucophlebia]|nr:hypothetical protein [Peltigera leucophlebia]
MLDDHFFSLLIAKNKTKKNSLRILTYQLIAEQSNYAPFSNTGYTDGRGGRYNSIENMHNVVHSLVGNGGHMSIIPYSAFDPIFWLHHANMDRLLAIWQAIYPDSWVNTSQINQIGTFTDAPGSIENINTPLTPFHSDRTGTLYNSQTARYTSTFGYTYPEIIDWNVTAAQLSSNVRRNLNALLNPSGTTTTNTANQGSQPPQKREKHTKKTIAEYPNAADHQYFVNIRVET